MLVDLTLPAGFYRNGTDYQSKGRYFDGNWIRFYEGQVRPIGGYEVRSKSNLTGACRAAVAWRDNQGQKWAGFGTHSGLYAMTLTGSVQDITPTSFTAGREDALTGGGYGVGAYGTNTYGTPRPDVDTAVPATIWSLDNWGENLVGVSDADGIIYEWKPNAGLPAQPVENAPRCDNILVTEQFILVAFGAKGDPRLIEWCAQQNNTEWDANLTNAAGDHRLVTKGGILRAINTQGGFLIFTDTDVHRATYSGAAFVYGFEAVSDIAALISKNAVIKVDTGAIWMGPQGFWTYNGFVQQLPCDVNDYVFNDLNETQRSKIYAVNNSEFGEVTWYYPSADSDENNRYVTYSYREQHWTFGEISRTAAVDSGPFENPLAVDAAGVVYTHEKGLPSHEPFLVSGPMDLGNGDRVVHVNQVLQDNNTEGSVQMTFRTQYETNGTKYSFGPYVMQNRTDVRVSGRFVSVEFRGEANRDWRLGYTKLEIELGETR